MGRCPSWRPPSPSAPGLQEIQLRSASRSSSTTVARFVPRALNGLESVPGARSAGAPNHSQPTQNPAVPLQGSFQGSGPSASHRVCQHVWGKATARLMVDAGGKAPTGQGSPLTHTCSARSDCRFSRIRGLEYPGTPPSATRLSFVTPQLTRQEGIRSLNFFF